MAVNNQETNFKPYGVCKSCSEIGDINMSHKNLKYLQCLMEKTELNPHQENLFSAIQKILEEDIPSFLRKTRIQQNKIASKYYIYYIKHRHLIEVEREDNHYPCYSPLRREEFQPEFQKYLALMKEIFGK